MITDCDFLKLEHSVNRTRKALINLIEWLDGRPLTKTEMDFLMNELQEPPEQDENKDKD